MARQLLAALVLFALMTPSLRAQETERQGQTQGQGPGQGQDPNGPTQAVSAVTTLPSPDKPRFLDKAKQWADDHQLMERLNGEIDGWYPRFGGMTRGSGFVFGPGYRVHLGNVLVDLSVGISTKSYKVADVKVRWLQAFDDRSGALDKLSLRGLPAGGLLRARADVAQEQPNELRLRQQPDPRAWPLQAGAVAPRR